MSGLYDIFARPALFSLDAEKAHGLSIKALKSGLHPRVDKAGDPRLAVDVAGLRFANPIGMAAGYDKNAEVPDALHALGFGHAEVGTVTPRPQKGNPKPRIFRLVRDHAVINRLGFNSAGHDAVLERLNGHQPQGITGINIGANKDSEDFAADYEAGIAAFAGLADYLTVNISSPNTPGLRGLQESDPLTDLLLRVSRAREASGHRVPIFVKIAPDLDEFALDSISAIFAAVGLDGLIISNTTLSRDGLVSSNSDETGGLSGAPLFERSTIVLAKMRQRLGRHVAIIGVGGVHDGKTALQKLEAGADLVQLYTGMIYRGPTLPGDILRSLSKTLDEENLATIRSVSGRKTAEWAAWPLTN